MSRTFSIPLAIPPERAEQLGQVAANLDGYLERPQDPETPRALATRLQGLGAQLWQESGLDANEVRQALDVARDEDSPVRLVVVGEEGQELPWELLHHPHPELGFVARHRWCGLQLEQAYKGCPRNFFGGHSLTDQSERIWQCLVTL